MPKYVLLDQEGPRVLLGDECGQIATASIEWYHKNKSSIGKPTLVDHRVVRLHVPREPIKVLKEGESDLPKRPLIGELELRERWFSAGGEMWPKTLCVAFDFVGKEWFLFKEDNE